MTHPGTLRRVHDAFVVARFATIQRGLHVPSGHDLIVGQGATIVGGIEGGRSVFLSQGVIVRGSIVAPIDVVVGAAARIEGDVEAGGNATILEAATVTGAVRASGRARIIAGHVLGGVEAAGDVEVRGQADLADIRAGGRIRSLPAPLAP